MDFSTIDITIFALYAVLILSIGLYVSRQKKGETKSAEDYFLAGKSLALVGDWRLAHCCQHLS
jgi:SSS family solute:Na+ symporter